VAGAAAPLPAHTLSTDPAVELPAPERAADRPDLEQPPADAQPPPESDADRPELGQPPATQPAAESDADDDALEQLEPSAAPPPIIAEAPTFEPPASGEPSAVPSPGAPAVSEAGRSDPLVPSSEPADPLLPPSEPADAIVPPSEPTGPQYPDPDEAAAAAPATAEAPAGGPRLPPTAPPAPAAKRVAVSRTPIRPARRPRGRSPLPRALALVALAAVVAAIVLLVKSLAGSGHERKVPAPAVARVVIPEGSTRLQIAQIAAADGLKGGYRSASKHSTLLDPTHYGAPAGTHDLEGFLFPATYDLFPGASVGRLVHEQLVAFRENFGSSEIARAHALHLTPYQLLTVASMVEREAKVPGDRPKIAAVIYNRLKKGMPLGVDATIYYALEMQKGIATYTKELTEAQLQLNSAYNTRTHTGLPPTPISNPGVASIEAASKPAHVSYLYYVLAADGCGEHTFATTLAKFEADAAAYRAAVKKNGGAPPTCKK
jgi:UPF0755 protein